MSSQQLLQQSQQTQQTMPSQSLLVKEGAVADIKTGDVKTGEVKADEVKTGEVKADEVKTAEVKTGEVKESVLNPVQTQPFNKYAPLNPGIMNVSTDLPNADIFLEKIPVNFNPPVLNISNKQQNMNIKSLDVLNPLNTSNITYNNNTFYFINTANAINNTSFTLEQILKFITYKYNSNFLKEISLDDKTKLVITNLICNYTYDDKIKKIDILIKKESEFMKDMKLVLYLNKLLDNYIKNSLSNNALYNKDFELKNIIIQFNLKLLNYTLELLEMANDLIKNDISQQSYKQHIQKYSSAVILKITSIVQDALISLNSKTNMLRDILLKSRDVRQDINKRLDDLEIAFESLNNAKSASASASYTPTTQELSKSVNEDDYNYSEDKSHVSGMTHI